MRENDMASYRLSSRKVLFSLLCIFLLTGGIVYIVDPFQHYRAASFYTPMFEHHRYLAPGIAKNFDYDTALIGTSMSANYYLPDVNRAFGARTVNLSLSGATPTEQQMMMELAAKNIGLKRIIMDFSVFSLENENKYRITPFPLYLYDDNSLNDIKYLLNFFPLKISWYIFEGNHMGKRADRFDPDSACNFPAKMRYTKENAYIAYKYEYQRHVDDIGPSGRAEFYKRVTGVFNEKFLPFIRNHPEIEFHLFMPPFSYLRWLSPYRSKVVGPDEVVAFYRHVLDATMEMKNVRLHDFHSELDIVMNLDNYMDLVHHSREVSRQVVEAMASGSNLLTDETIDKHIDEFRAMLASVDREALHRELGLK